MQVKGEPYEAETDRPPKQNPGFAPVICLVTSAALIEVVKLTSCPFLLANGRARYRHDNLLSKAIKHESSLRTPFSSEEYRPKIKRTVTKVIIYCNRNP